MSHQALAAAVLSDPEGGALVAQARERNDWTDERGVASNMVAWFSQHMSTQRTRWGELFDRTRQHGRWAYRPKAEVRASLAHDPETSAMEGELRMVFHLRRERDATLARAKRQSVLDATGRLACEACGFETRRLYPGLDSDVCEVHHRRPLAEASELAATTLEDLALLCANCHRAIHRIKPVPDVEVFRTTYFAPREAEGCRPPMEDERPFAQSQ